MSDVTRVRHCRLLWFVALFLGVGLVGNAQTSATSPSLFYVAVDGLTPYQYADMAKQLDTHQVTIEQACVPIGLVCFKLTGAANVNQGFAHVHSVFESAASVSSVVLREDVNATVFDEQCLAARKGQ